MANNKAHRISLHDRLQPAAMTMDRLHITGASGSGTTTLGGALAARLALVHLDADDFFWEPTDPPYRQPREVPVRQALLAAALDRQRRWVLSGSLVGWGDSFVPRFDGVVFLAVPPEQRLARLRDRERARYGAAALAPGGALHESHEAFMSWAGRYDDGDFTVRSRQLHEWWLARLPCPVLRIEGESTVEESVDRVVAFITGR